VNAVAWLAGAPLDEDGVLAHVGPGLAAAADSAPIAALTWNAFAFAMGRRLLIAMSTGDVPQHVVDICAQAIVLVANVDDLLGRPDGELVAGTTEATLRPMTMLSRAPGAELIMRLWTWGMRRLQRDRRLADTLAAIAAEACALHAQMAERAGGDGAAASAQERAAQLADARSVLAGAAATLVGMPSNT
jgi:hypothetical protein